MNELGCQTTFSFIWYFKNNCFMSDGCLHTILVLHREMEGLISNMGLWFSFCCQIQLEAAISCQCIFVCCQFKHKSSPSIFSRSTFTDGTLAEAEKNFDSLYHSLVFHISSCWNSKQGENENILTLRSPLGLQYFHRNNCSEYVFRISCLFSECFLFVTLNH